ncbi:MAG: cytochrome c3 family protein [Nitrospirota bacterium]
MEHRNVVLAIIDAVILSVVVFLLGMAVVFAPEGGRAAVVSKECGDCHVLYPGMMKAEEGKAQNIICVNCHASNNADTVKVLGGVKVPVVRNTVEPRMPLAGGNFYHIAALGDRRGHNVDGISPRDEKFGGLPPGYNRSLDPSLIGFVDSKPLTCAGANGCHGDRSKDNPFEAIRGAHHAKDAPLDGSSTAKSFRYLKITGKLKGVTGLEDKDWLNVSSTKHNEYAPSMSLLCAGCHGDFHSREAVGPASPWFRHPTDVVLPKRGEYGSYKMYSPSAPVARTSLPEAVSGQVSAGDDVVMCLSCHFAHAGPHESLLRWDYDAVVSGEATPEGGGGCFICHAGKL